MGKFADPTYPQPLLPPILKTHWDEIKAFQKECHTVTLRVLTLFALALDVISHLKSSLIIATARLFCETT
jgi:isopenicillin N synthase-like dioxygenase